MTPPLFKIRPLGKGPSKRAPAKVQLSDPNRYAGTSIVNPPASPGITEHRVTHQGRKQGSTYTPHQESTVHRCRAEGISKADTAKAAGLTIQQVHYLLYVKPRQQGIQAKRRATITPLVELVPEPITANHTNTLPEHKYRGQPTSLRADVIEQVRKCKGERHPIAAVAEHFRMKPATVRYIWYQLGQTRRPDAKP